MKVGVACANRLAIAASTPLKGKVSNTFRVGKDLRDMYILAHRCHSQREERREEGTVQ
jgi:hypothetical protein